MVRTKVAPLIILILAFVVYSYRLDLVPVHLNQDELAFSLNAHSIAKTLHDENGRFLPFYIFNLHSIWATPIAIYLTSVILVFLPLMEENIRLSGVIAAVTSMALMILLVKQIFNNNKLALLSVFLLAISPAFFINSRALLDNVFPIPFVLGWLLFLKRFLNQKKGKDMFISGLLLGIGFHSYHAAKIMMPVYFLFTAILLQRENIKTKSRILFLIGFLIPILVFIPWLIKYPETLLFQVSYVGGIDKSVDIGRGVFGIFNVDRLGIFLSSYATYFSPKILFAEGDRSLVHSTSLVGAFPFAYVFLLIFGVISVLFQKKDAFSKLILLGFLTYPIAPSIVNDPQRISRGLVVVPFVVLLSVFALEFMYQSKEKVLPFLAKIIIVFALLEFSVFLMDYFGDYRNRSAAWFNYNIAETLESVIKSTQIRKVDRIYMDDDIWFLEIYFRFYEKKMGVEITQPKSFFDHKNVDFSEFPEYSLVIIKAGNVKTKEDEIGEFEKIETIREPNGNESFYIYYYN